MTWAGSKQQPVNNTVQEDEPGPVSLIIWARARSNANNGLKLTLFVDGTLFASAAVVRLTRDGSQNLLVVIHRRIFYWHRRRSWCLQTRVAGSDLRMETTKWSGVKETSFQKEAILTVARKRCQEIQISWRWFESGIEKKRVKSKMESAQWLGKRTSMRTSCSCSVSRSCLAFDHEAGGCRRSGEGAVARDGGSETRNPDQKWSEFFESLRRNPKTKK